jgi:hypothetical protein
MISLPPVDRISSFSELQGDLLWGNEGQGVAHRAAVFHWLTTKNSLSFFPAETAEQSAR